MTVPYLCPQVCINNNHLAAIYSVLAKDSLRAKFLTSDDLQLLSAFLTYHYSQDENGYLTNFRCVEGRRIPPSIPRFYAMPYRTSNKIWGVEFEYSREFLDEYRKAYSRCLYRFGRNWDSATNDARIKLSKHLSDLKSRERLQLDSYILDLKLTAESQILEDASRRDWLISTATKKLGGIGIQRDGLIGNLDKKDWIESQFYVMREEMGSKESMKTLNDLLSLLEDYFNTGLPCLLYYQRTGCDQTVGLKLNFGEIEKKRFVDAFGLAVQNFAQTSRLRINNENFATLKHLMEEEGVSVSEM